MSIVDGDLKSLFKKNIPGHWIHVESGSTSGGIPDLNFCIDGVEGWVETKQTHAWSVKFRPTQVALISARARAGGRIWVAVRRWKRQDGADELWLVHGSHVRTVAAGGLIQDSLIYTVWKGGPRKWDWAQIAGTLVG